MFSTSLLLLLAAASYVHGVELTQPASMTVQPGQSLSIHCKSEEQRHNKKLCELWRSKISSRSWWKSNHHELHLSPAVSDSCVLCGFS
ncbi:hypothetical protein KOW79_001869 [Hemibagrus wyckioides]|uniref:Uncharacterized protein n=1 Tax=Hemibagrus wyckioides TaxID=337641 RepID=A0A9D3P5X4_9TELE|nr:hypothetical protein KOW79_001869 [Hemibagrus wyckioides]